MASRTTDLMGRLAAPVFFAFIGLFIVLSAYQKQQWDSDIFWALKSGEWIVTNLKVPHTDPFSYTFGGQPWVDFTWGFQVLSYLSFSFLGGWTGLFILQVAAVSLTFAFLYVALRTHFQDRPYLAACLLVLAYTAAHTRLFIRPHLFEFFFVSLYFMLFALYEKKGSPAYLFLILPAQLLWVNIHSSAVLGLFMAGAFAFGKLVDEVRERGVRNFDLGKGVIMPGVAALLAPVVSLVNPYGLKLVIFPFIHNSVDNTDAIRHIGEWAKPGLKDLFFFVYPFPLQHFAFLVIFIAAAVCLILNWRNVRTWAYILFAGALYMAVSHVRWVALFAVFGAPVLAIALKGVFEKTDIRGALKPAAILAAALLAVLLARDHMKPGSAVMSNLGLGVKTAKFPEGNVAYIRKEGLRGNIYNEYVYGGYLIYEVPEVKVFIDGRTPTVYSPYFFWTSRVAELQGRWKRLQDEHGIDMVLVKFENGLCGKLRDNKEWAAVSFDDVSMLYLRKDRFPAQTARGLSSVNPCAEDKKFDLPEGGEELEGAVSEIEKLMASGNMSAKPRRLLGLAYAKLGVHEKAVASFMEAIAIHEDAYTWYDLGVSLGKMKKRAEAAAAFEKAVAIDGKFKEGWLALGAARRDGGDYKQAIAALTRYIDLADDRAEGLAYSSLGMSYFNTGEFEKAVAYLKRAAFVTDGKKELAGLYYHIGNAHFELADYGEGARWYGKAISVQPDYANAVKELALGLWRDGKKDAADAIFTLDTLKASRPADN